MILIKYIFMKWADFDISKLSFNTSENKITEVLVHKDNDSTIGGGEIKDRNWLVQKINSGETFCCITRKSNGNRYKLSNLIYKEKAFKWAGSLPKNLTCHKTFVSYYHKEDQDYREKFENLFGDLVVSKSVEDGDIDPENSAEYTKQLIQKGYLSDTTVLVVLVGLNTKHRKHIDWEISGALNHKIGDGYAGLVGILLPTHPDYGKATYNPNNIPKRLTANVNSGYAKLYDWTEDRKVMQEIIEKAFKRRAENDKIENKSIPQMQRNTNS